MEHGIESSQKLEYVSDKRHKSDGWTSFIQCCFPKTPEDKTFADDSNKCDYFVEKLVIKRIPPTMFTTQNDIHEVIKANGVLNKTVSCLEYDKVEAQTISPDTELSSSVKKNVQNNVHNPDLKMNYQFIKFNKPTSSWLSTQETLFVQSAREGSILDSKTPEDKSAALAQKISSSTEKSTINELSDFNVALSNKKAPFKNESGIEKVFSPRSSPCHKVEDASSYLFSQKTLKARSENLNIGRHLVRSSESQCTNRTTENTQRFYNQSSFHNSCESSKLQSTKKYHTEKTDFELIKPLVLGVMKSEKGMLNSTEVSSNAETSTTSESCRSYDAAGMTLRWKIIIKHNQPTTPKNQDSKITTLGNDTKKSKNVNSDDKLS